MATTQSTLHWMSRRDILAGSAAVLAGGLVGGAGLAYATIEAPAGGEPPPLPWKWVELDPMEAGRRAYRFYMDKGGCGTASYLSILSMLQEQVGYPWTTLPDMMMIHAAAGYGGHGTLCGALGGASCIINLATYSAEPDPIYRQLIDRLFYWYARQEFPTKRFDDISKMPNQVTAPAHSPLCHTSVSSWTLAAGEEVNSAAKKERCAKVSGEVVYTVVYSINEYFAGRWTPPKWQPSDEIAHCVKCHGPDNMMHTNTRMNQQQGHMECLMCHGDHTKR
jgi:hypothetical protein